MSETIFGGLMKGTGINDVGVPFFIRFAYPQSLSGT